MSTYIQIRKIKRRSQVQYGVDGEIRDGFRLADVGRVPPVVMVLRHGRVQAHGIPVAPMTGQRPGLAEPFAAHRTPERLLLDVYVPAHRATGNGHAFIIYSENDDNHNYNVLCYAYTVFTEHQSKRRFVHVVQNETRNRNRFSKSTFDFPRLTSTRML